MSLKFMVFFIVTLCTNRIAGKSGSLIIGGKKRNVWYSEPFEHKCVNDCSHEVEHSQSGEVSIMKKNCSVLCDSGATIHHRYEGEQYKRIQVKNAQTGARSECLIGILGEDIFCARMSIKSGIRQWNIDNINQCRRKNYRYFLARSLCDTTPHYEVGEESCLEACIQNGYISGHRHIILEAGRQRAHFRVCYDGMVAENTAGHGRFWHFCRAEMTSCSACFRWGSWISATACSSTCGAKGVVTFVRSCEIKDSSGVYRSSNSYKTVANGYCVAYFGGSSTKTEPCNPNTACPGWTQWGPWLGCPKASKPANEENNDFSKIKKCKTSRKRRSVENIETNLTSVEFPEEIVVKPTSTIQIVLNDSNQEAPQTLKNAGRIGYRTRHCWPMRRRCVGNSTEYGRCDDINKKKVIAQSEETDDCDDEMNMTTAGTTEITPNTTITMAQSSEEPTTTETNVMNKIRTTPTVTTTKSIDVKNRPNRNFTLDDEDGFTSIINDYAPALIAGLLIFIVLLLIALIAVCGYRIMQKKNRRTPTPPSFSAGTMGSIPSGLVQGFSHILGLRHGSGTFGRSESTINEVGHINETQINKDSGRNIANGGHTTKIKTVSSSSQIATVSGGDYSTNRHHNQAIELGAMSKPTSLSTTSSSSAFHPLPPIPPNQRMGNSASVFKRGAGRSSSLNPTVNQSSLREKSQPRAESVSGRMTGQQRSGTGSPWRSDRKALATPNSRRSDGPSGAYCEHDCSSSSCGDKEKHSTTVTENEYWSVTREGCFDSSTQSRDRTRSTNSVTDSTRSKMRTERFQPQNTLGEDNEEDANEMVDNVLYSVATGVQFSRDKSIDEVKESNDLKTTESKKQFHSQFESDEASRESEIDTSTEDDYDHLCDQFGGPTSKQLEKHPGTMTSLHQLRHHSFENLDDDNTRSVNPHDYESIQFESQEEGNASDEESIKNKRAASNEYVMTVSDGAS